MNKGKQVLIAMLCGFDQDHEIYKDVLKDPDTARQMIEDTTLTKADLFSATMAGKSVFEYRETWNGLDKLVAQIRKNGEDISAADFTEALPGGKSALQHAETLRTLPILLAPWIWKGRLKDAEDLWFRAGNNAKEKLSFQEIRRKIAAASGKRLREDRLTEIGVSLTDLRNALDKGTLETVTEKLVAAGDRLRKEDLFLLDDSGETLLHGARVWQHFDRIALELAKNGEYFTKDDFLAKHGSGTSLLNKAIKFTELDRLFSLAVWKGRPREMLDLYAAIPEPEWAKINIYKTLADVTDGILEKKMAASGKSPRLETLTEAFNVASSSGDFSCSFRPLGLQSTWARMGAIREGLKSGGEKITLDHLRLASGEGGESCLMAAARLRFFDTAMDILDESGESLCADDLLTKGGRGQTLLDVLSDTQQLKPLFVAKHWVGRSQDMLSVWENVPEKAREGIDIKKILGEVNRLSLRRKFAGPDPAP